MTTLLLTRSLWGLEEDPHRYIEALPDIVAAGFDAVACPVQLLPDADAFADALATHELAYVPQIFTFGSTVADHVTMFRDGVERAQRFSPPHILCHAGRDGWPRAMSLAFLTEAVSMGADLGVRVAHETHRGRIFFHPWITAELLDEIPELWFNADLSHWVVVTESIYLPPKILSAIAPRVLHIDARVGFEQGPQVADPAAGRFAEQVSAHEAWWDEIWAAREAAGAELLSVTAEYGPPPYQPVDPSSGEPARPLAEVVTSASERLRVRYGHRQRE